MSDVNKLSGEKQAIPGEDISRVYFLGIGGIGMSALARYFLHHDIAVSGYDKTATALTKELENEGAKIHYEDDEALLDKEAELIIYTPAIPKAHKGFNFYKDNDYRLLKRSEVLALIMQDTYNICVAGTHGKTTTSAMLAHILSDTGYGCTVFLGGIAANQNANFWVAPVLENNAHNTCVAEADEYDRSFLKLKPDVAVITAMDADHLDIYGDEKTMQDAFVDFTRQIKTGGTLMYKKGVARSAEFEADHKLSYDVYDSTASVHANNIRVIDGSYLFDVELKDNSIREITLNMGGMHNVENAVVAVAVSAHLGIDEQKIKKALADFKGVKRRFEYVVKDDNHVFIDDYAHHPQELRALIRGAKELFPGKKCTVIFQPHLYSRTKDLAADFAHALEMADEVILLPVYPARELPVEGVESHLIADQIHRVPVSIEDRESVLKWVADNRPALLISSGAGDIDLLVEPIKQILVNK